MKKIILMMTAFLIVGLAFAQTPQEKGFKGLLNSQQATTKSSILTKSAKFKSAKKATFSPQKVDEDYTPVTPPSDLETTELPLEGLNLIDEEALSSTVNVGTSGSDVYIQGLVPIIPEAWVKGTIEGGVVTFEPQFVGYLEEDSPCFLMSCDDDDTLLPFVMFYDAEINAYDAEGLMLLYPNTTELNYDFVQGLYLGIHIGDRPDVVTPPEGMEITSMRFSGLNLDDEKVSGTVNVGIDGKDVYIQNLLSQVSDAWIKGTMNDDFTQVTFPCGQYVGVSKDMLMPVYIVGLVENEDVNLGNIIFNYDQINNTFELQSFLLINLRKDEIYLYDYFQPGLVIGKPSDIAWVAGEQGYTNGQEITTIEFDKYTTGTLAKNSGKANPTYNEANGAIMLNANNTFTVSSSKKIGKIILTMEGANQQLTTDCGEYSIQGSNENLGVWEGDSKNVVFTVPNNAQASIKAVNIYYFDYSTTLVEVPEDLATKAYLFAGTNLENDEEVIKEVNVGFYGENEVYIQGLSEYVEDAWVKGELNNDTLSIPGWYLGLYDSINGLLEIVFTPTTFKYDKDNDTFLTDSLTSYSEKMNSVMDEFENVVLTKIVDKSAMPKQPEITEFIEAEYGNSIRMEIPVKDTDDKLLIPSKLGYQLFIDIEKEVSELTFTPKYYDFLDEEMTIVPYDFTDNYDFTKHGKQVYLNQPEQENWNRIGVRSVYTGGGETNATEISWYVLKEYDPNGIINITSDTTEQPIYNLQGIRVSKMQKHGLYIQGGKKFIK